MKNTVSISEFQTRAGQYIESSANMPVYITKHGRPVRVLIDVGEYEWLKAYDTRQAFYPHELPNEMKAELEKGYQGPSRPELDQMMQLLTNAPDVDTVPGDELGN
jgi:prevent-host-death family protein